MILGYPHFRTPHISIYQYIIIIYIYIHILVLLVREINLLQCLERSWTWLWHGTVPLEPGTKLLELIGSWVHAYQRMCSIHKYLKLRTQCTHANMSKPLTILLRRRCILGFVLEDTFHWMSHLLWCALANKGLCGHSRVVQWLSCFVYLFPNNLTQCIDDIDVAGRGSM